MSVGISPPWLAEDPIRDLALTLMDRYAASRRLSSPAGVIRGGAAGFRAFNHELNLLLTSPAFAEKHRLH